MPLVVPNASELVALDHLKSIATKIKLYKSDTTPTGSTVVGDLTEADFSGYAAANLTWGSASTVSNKASITASDVTFTASSGSQTIRGYYITKTDGTLLWVERFETSKTIDSSNPITISPKFTLSSEN